MFMPVTARVSNMVKSAAAFSTLPFMPNAANTPIGAEKFSIFRPAAVKVRAPS
jgi:hypothetical protein